MRRSSVSVRTTTTSRVTCRSSFGFQRRLSVLLGSPGRVIRAYGPAGANSVWEKSPIPKSDGEGRFVAGLSVRSFGAGAAKRRLASEKRAEEEEDQLPYSACLSETFDFQLSSGSRNEMTDAAIQKNATGAKS